MGVCAWWYGNSADLCVVLCFFVCSYTYLDSTLNGGRPVVTLTAHNIVPEHDQDVRITYTFSRSKLVLEPLMLVGIFFVLFVAASLIARTTGITMSSVKKSASAAAVQGESNEKNE